MVDKMQRFSPHNHTEMSNFRLLDCINKLPDLVKRGKEIGLAGLAVTDHETIAQSIRICKLQKENPDFKIAIGNEIYLTDTRDKGIKYYHFILIAKDAVGHKQLRQLSSTAWMNSYWDRGMERVPTLKSELVAVVKKNPGHLIATSACLGGELSSCIIEMEHARKIEDVETANRKHQQIKDFMFFCDDLFGDDFYIEVAPGASKDQIIANNKLAQIAQVFHKKLVIGDDAHYLKKEDRYIHKAYLNSKGGERETDAFYEYAYLQSDKDIRYNLEPSIGILIEEMYVNSMEMFDKIEVYDLLHNQTIPRVPIKDYPKKWWNTTWDWNEEKKEIENYRKVDSLDFPILSDMYHSDDIYERYWINECLYAMFELKKVKPRPEYFKRLEEEARVKRIIGEKLGTNMFKYPITLKYYIDMMWECGSLVGAGRGSSCAALNHYLLGITQLDPIEWNLPFFRYMNEERVELGDIDIDICPSKKGTIVKKIKEERGSRFNPDIDELSRKNLGCTLIATYGTEQTKSAVLTACRGYRSEEYTDGIDNDEAQYIASLIPSERGFLWPGIDNDEAQYIASLIPSERGFLWPLEDVINGNKDKGREPVHVFVKEVNTYPGLLDIIFGIVGLVNKRSSHASGVILFDEDPYEFGCFMKTPKGEVVL